MNLGGYKEPEWEDWQKHFCWLPKKIRLKKPIPNSVYSSDYIITKWVWLKKIYVRRKRVRFYPTVSYVDFEYEYAEDLFDLIKQESR